MSMPQNRPKFEVFYPADPGQEIFPTNFTAFGRSEQKMVFLKGTLLDTDGKEVSGTLVARQRDLWGVCFPGTLTADKQPYTLHLDYDVVDKDGNVQSFSK